MAVDTRKAIAVLAVLAVDRRPVRRDTLAALLWPEASQERARATLRRTLSSLRTALGADRVVADRETVGLAHPTDYIDVCRFTTVANRDPAAAIGLYRGPLLEGFSTPDAPEFEDWQRREAERHRMWVDRLLDELAAAAPPRDAVHWSRKRFELDVANEAACRQLMTALGAVGDRASAVAAYRDLVRGLYEQLGVEPMEETTALYERVRRGGGRPVKPVPLIRTAPIDVPLIGRDADLGRLGAAVQACRFVVISGEAGVGLTRVLHEWAAGRAGTISVSCHAGEAGVAWAPFVEWLPSGPDSGQLEVFEHLATALGLDAGGTAAIDDLDLADDASVAFVTHVLHRPERFPGTIVATAGMGHRGTDSGIWELLEEGLAEGWADEIRLGRLGDVDIGSVVRAAGVVDTEAVERIVRNAEGLPLLAIEYARAPADEVPSAVERRVSLRLAGLSAVARQVTEVLGVVERPIADDTLQVIAGRTDDEMAAALSELVGAEVVRSLDPVELSHRLLGTVAVAALAPGRKRTLHRRAADALPASEAAHHATASSDPDLAGLLHRQAALAAIDAHAVGAALKHLYAALDCGLGTEGSIHLEIGDLELLEGHYVTARRAYEACAARATGAALADVELRLVEVARRMGDPGLEASHLDSAEVEAPAGDTRLATEIVLARAHAVADDPARAWEISDPLDLIRGGDDPVLEARAHAVAALAAYRRGDLAGAEREAQEAISTARLAPEPPLAVEAGAANICGLAIAGRDPNEALRHFDRARELLQRLGDRHRLAAVHANLGDAFHAAGQDERARAHQIEASRLFAEVSGSPEEGRAELWSLNAW